MIQIGPSMRILVAVEPVDFRRGIDGLAQVCREVLESDPFSGTLFVFRGRSGTSIKLLAFDGQVPPLTAVWRTRISPCSHIATIKGESYRLREKRRASVVPSSEAAG